MSLSEPWFSRVQQQHVHVLSLSLNINSKLWTVNMNWKLHWWAGCRKGWRSTEAASWIKLHFSNSGQHLTNHPPETWALSPLLVDHVYLLANLGCWSARQYPPQTERVQVVWRLAALLISTSVTFTSCDLHYENDRCYLSLALSWVLIN